MLDKLFGLFSHDIAIDLGTANTLVAVRGKGVMIREPSIVTRHKKTKQVLAVGQEAKRMWGKTPHTLEVIRPLRGGVIADFDATEAMLMKWIRSVHEPSGVLPRLPRPRVIIGIPSGVTEVERRAVQEAALSAGARQAWLIEESMAAALGAGAPIDEPVGIFVVDIGGGTTEIAVISMAGPVVSKSIRIAGDAMDEAVINYLRLKQAMLIGPATAERVKMELGSVGNTPPSPPLDKGGKGEAMIIRGRDLETGLPKSLKITSEQVAIALEPTIGEIVMAVKETIDVIPPELMVDILERGIILAGGGSLIGGLPQLMAQVTKLPVQLAEDPLTCVVRGCLSLYENPDLLAKVRVTGGLR